MNHRTKILLSALAGALAAGLPAGAQAAGCGDTYVVRAGDWLSRIAERCDTPMQDIRQLNPALNPNRIEIGQEIVLAEPEPVQPIIEVRGGPRADLPPAPPEKGPVQLTATVTRDAGTCLYLTDDLGRTYSFAAGETDAKTGMTVTVSGEVVDNWYCAGGAEILVDEMAVGPAEPQQLASVARGAL